MKRVFVAGALGLGACSLFTSLDGLHSGDALDGGGEGSIGADGGPTSRWCATRDAMICADFDDNVLLIPTFTQTGTGLVIVDGGLSAPNALGTKTGNETTTQVASLTYPPKQLAVAFDIYFPVTNDLGEKVDIVQLSVSSGSSTANFFIEYDSARLKFMPQGSSTDFAAQLGRWTHIEAELDVVGVDGGGSVTGTFGVDDASTPISKSPLAFVADRSQTTIGMVNHTTTGQFALRIDNFTATLR